MNLQKQINNKKNHASCSMTLFTICLIISIFFIPIKVFASQVYTYDKFTNNQVIKFISGNITIGNGQILINKITVSNGTAISINTNDITLNTSKGDIKLNAQYINRYALEVNAAIPIDSTWIEAKITGITFSCVVSGNTTESISNMEDVTQNVNSVSSDGVNLIIPINPPPERSTEYDYIIPISGPITITQDEIINSIPTVSVTSPILNYFCQTGATTLTLQGSVSDLELGDILAIQYSIDGGTANMVNGTITTSGNFSKTDISISSLAKGTHTLDVWCTDNHGNSSSIKAIPFYICYMPTEDGTADKNGTSQSADFNIIVNAVTGTNVFAATDNGNALKAVSSVAAVNGKAVLPIDISKLDFGVNNISICDKDSGGNASNTLVVTVTRNVVYTTAYKIDIIDGQEYNIAFTGWNIANLDKNKYLIEYNPDELDVLDLCSLTKLKELSIGNITGTNIQMIEFTKGRIVFKINEDVPSGYGWRGVLDVIKFKALKLQTQSIIKVSNIIDITNVAMK